MEFINNTNMVKKKILFLIPTLMNGGAERVLTNLVNNLDQNKFDIYVKTIMDVGRFQSKLKSHIHYSYVFGKLVYGTSTIFKLFSPNFLFNCIVGNNYDIVVSYLEGPTARIVSGCTNPQIKLVSWIHIELNTDAQFANGFRSVREAIACYNKFNMNVCVAETVRRIFCKYPIDSSKTCVRYNTNETTLIREMSLEKVDDVIFNKDVLNICSVAKIVKTKGFDRLARIHKRLKDEGYKTHFYIIGEGNQRSSIEKFIVDNKCTETFTFVGYRENPYKYISKCDLYVCSSLREGFSTAVTEALVLGLPVISTNCSGAVELLGENNEYGIVTDNDEDSLYQAIKKFLEDPNLLPLYKVRSKKRGCNFETESTVKAVESLFQNL